MYKFCNIRFRESYGNVVAKLYFLYFARFFTRFHRRRIFRIRGVCELTDTGY